MASVTKLGVVLLPTLLAVKELPAGWVVLLQLVFQMALLVEHGLRNNVGSVAAQGLCPRA